VIKSGSAHGGWLRYPVSRPTESPDEELARDIVSTVLGVPVERFEDGTAPGQVDALIHYSDREAALEVVADHDPVYNKQPDALRRTKDQIEVSGLRKSWMVLLSRRANINRVKAALPELLLDFQDNPPPRRRPWDEPSELDRLGLTKAWPMDRSPVSGRVWLVPQAWGGFAGTEHTIGEWVTKVLRREADVVAKLAAHPDVAERHAFIWATPTSDMEVQTQLESGDDHPFPVTGPKLPGGVTHVGLRAGCGVKAGSPSSPTVVGGGHHGRGHQNGCSGIEHVFATVVGANIVPLTASP
jgi:hypothetical protein